MTFNQHRQALAYLAALRREVQSETFAQYADAAKQILNTGQCPAGITAPILKAKLYAARRLLLLQSDQFTRGQAENIEARLYGRIDRARYGNSPNGDQQADNDYLRLPASQNYNQKNNYNPNH